MPSQRFRQQGWDQWGVFRDASVVSCMEYTDPAEVCSSAREEGGTVEEVCPDAMPPTGASAFEYHLPVNNKWRTKYPIYDRHTINDPEYLMDVVLDYHMRHDQAADEVAQITAEHQTIASVIEVTPSRFNVGLDVAPWYTPVAGNFGNHIF